MFTEVGGLANEEHLAWIKHKHVRVGDEIRVKIVEAGSVERPVQKRRTHLAETLRAKKRYVRTMAKEVSWKIQARST